MQQNHHNDINSWSFLPLFPLVWTSKQMCVFQINVYCKRRNNSCSLSERHTGRWEYEAEAELFHKPADLRLLAGEVVGSRVSQCIEGRIQLLAICLPAPVPVFSWAATLFSHLLRWGPTLPGVGNEMSLDPGTGSGMVQDWAAWNPGLFQDRVRDTCCLLLCLHWEVILLL